MEKKTVLTLAMAALLCVTSLDASGKSSKRGVCESGACWQGYLNALEPGTTWFYNWGITPQTNLRDYLGEETMEYVPMCWSGNFNATALREYCASHPEVKYLLGFNEPNFVAQANMSPEAAAERWPQVQALAEELGLELVGPAVNYSPNTDTHPDYEMYTWYRKFVDLVGIDAFDYIALHCYSGGTAGMQEMIDNFYEEYGKPIWLTEFSMGGDGGIPNMTVDQQLTSMVQQLEYLEKSDKVFRYAWFMANPGSGATAPYIRLVEHQVGEGESTLTELGNVYVYMTDFDETVFHGIDELVPASEYISSKSIKLGTSHDVVNPGMLEITQFTSGAYTDYQFDIPSAGEYTLSLRVSGVGEPTRFDPNIAIYSVDEDGQVLSTLCEARQFELSGSDTEYARVEFPMTLQAGRQRIRVADAGPYQPSGIHISCLSFDSQLAGIGEVAKTATAAGLSCVERGGVLYVAGTDDAALCEVYDMNGRLLASGKPEGGALQVGELPRGVYVLKAMAADDTVMSAKFIK